MGNVTVADGVTAWVGGFVGWEDADTTITASYSTGIPTAGSGQVVGGFVGLLGTEGPRNAIVPLYSMEVPAAGSGQHADRSAGSPQFVDNSYCYWDTTTSGTTIGVGSGSSAGVTGMTDAQFRVVLFRAKERFRRAYPRGPE